MAVDAAMLMAYLDGELDEPARAEVEAALAADPKLARELDRQRRLCDTLRARYDPIADEPVPARLRALIEPGIVDLQEERRRRWRPAWPAAAAIAASLMVGILVGRTLPEGMSDPVGIERGRLIAQGTLANALERQLASEQQANAATKIGVSFARADGNFCRTFDSDALAGLACRTGGAWQLVAIAEGNAPPRGGGYRQAGSGNALIMEAAQQMMAGEPLEAEGERRARDAGWSR